MSPIDRGQSSAPDEGRTHSGHTENTVQWTRSPGTPSPDDDVQERAESPSPQNDVGQQDADSSRTTRGNNAQSSTDDPAGKTRGNHDVTMVHSSGVAGDGQDFSVSPSVGDEEHLTAGSRGTAQTLEMVTQDADSFHEPKRRGLRFKRLGRFEIVRVLGEGAFGVVYLAHDPQLDRQVALKVAKTGMLVRESDRARFLREARAAAQLRHPNIVPVYEFGQIEEVNYIAYQYIEGKSLKSVLRSEDRLPIPRATEIIEKLASALDYAHKQGIIHRDMKPDNVLIDPRGEAHITDFGCARRDEGGIRRTVEGSIMGTPAYMSPEQATGRSNEADGRSDVWSLGIMLEEALTGVLPFQGTLTQVLMDIREREAPSLRQLDPNLPRDLETICQKCLTKNPLERFQTAGELAEELQRFRRGEPIRSRPISPLARAWRWAKRNPTVAALLTTIVVGSVTSTIIISLSWQKSIREARTRAVAQLASLRGSAPESVPVMIENIRPFRQQLAPQIEQQLKDVAVPGEQTRLRMALLALGSGPATDTAELIRSLRNDMLGAEPAELLVIREVLQPHAAQLVDELWQTAADGSQPKSARIRAAAALAEYDTLSPRWHELAGDVVGQLVTEDRSAINDWVKAFVAVRTQLAPLLRNEFRDASDSQKQQVAAAVLAEMFSDDFDVLTELALESQPLQLAELLRKLQRVPQEAIKRLLPVAQEKTAADQQASAADQRNHANRIANVEMCLVALGMPELLWRRLGDNSDPSIRTLEITYLGLVGIDPQLLKRRLLNAPPTANGLETSGILLALGHYDPGRLFLSEREALAPVLADLFRKHPHPAVHSAAQWLLRRWQLEEHLTADANQTAADARENATPGDPMQPASAEDQPRWVTTSSGQTLVVLGPVDASPMGSEYPPSGGLEVDPIHNRQIPRRFAIATREVTTGEFLRFTEVRMADLARREQEAQDAGDQQLAAKLALMREELEIAQLNRNASTDESRPIVNVTWFEAAAYCRWLGEQEGLAESDHCFPSIDTIEDLAAQFKPLLLKPEAINRSGYRLPTSGEWEYACRAGTLGRYPFGEVPLDVAAHYAWTADNAQDHTWPVARKQPNDFGLFDMVGNAFEWTYDWKLALPVPNAAGLIVDGTEDRRGAQRQLRGGSYKEFLNDLQVAAQSALRPEQGDVTVGFRVARTWLAE